MTWVGWMIVKVIALFRENWVRRAIDLIVVLSKWKFNLSWGCSMLLIPMFFIIIYMTQVNWIGIIIIALFRENWVKEIIDLIVNLFSWVLNSWWECLILSVFFYIILMVWVSGKGLMIIALFRENLVILFISISLPLEPNNRWAYLIPQQVVISIPWLSQRNIFAPIWSFTHVPLVKIVNSRSLYIQLQGGATGGANCIGIYRKPYSFIP